MNILDILLNNNKKINHEELKYNFKLPIEFQNSCKEIDPNLILDLELESFKNLDLSNLNTNTGDDRIKKNLYYLLFLPNNDYEENTISYWNKFYSNDKNFLIETQYIIENFNTNKFNFSINDLSLNYDNIINNYNNLISCENFIDEYDFISLPYVDKFNTNETILQAWIGYNFLSPLINLIIPIISMILPFFIIKIQGYNITFETYFIYLKNLLKNHALGNLFCDFKKMSISNLIYVIITIGLYIYQLYSNVNSCKKNYVNYIYIMETLNNLKTYLNETLLNMNNFSKLINSYSTYNEFNSNLKINISKLEKFGNELEYIKYKDLKSTKNKNFIKMGYFMKYFYNIYNDSDLVSSLYYSFSFNGYLKNIESIKNYINKNVLNKCSFDNNNTDIKDSCYIGLLDDSSNNIVKNSIDLNKNILISGPNASGKTTVLKSCLFNILISQQIGYGFYKSANIKIYDYIHCYINIPDTNERDSLFQAEARKCKTIIDSIQKNKNAKHFCVFDEIFSGTNPSDAIKNGLSYLKYLNKYSNVDYILTTHYNKICKNSDKKYCENLKMKIKKNKNNIKFTYKIEKGINKINGGSKILKDLEFPEEIINKN